MGPVSLPLSLSGFLTAFVTEHKSLCPRHSEAKQYQKVGVWSTERFIAGPCKEMRGSCLKNPKSLKLSAKPFYRKGEGGVQLVVAKFLLSDTSFLRSGHDVPVNLHQNAILCSDKKGQGLKAQLSPSEVQALAVRRGSLRAPVTLPRSPAPSLGPPTSAQAQLRRQTSAGDALRTRSPDPAQLSSLREPGAQGPAGPEAPQAAQMGDGGPGPVDCNPG